MGQQVGAAAVAARLTPPPPTLLPPQQAMLDQLRVAGTGYSFDMAFQQTQIQAHQQAIQLMQNYATSGDVPALRTAAAGADPGDAAAPVDGAVAAGDPAASAAAATAASAAGPALGRARLARSDQGAG